MDWHEYSYRRNQRIWEQERERWLEPDDEEPDETEAKEIAAELKWEMERGQ